MSARYGWINPPTASASSAAHAASSSRSPSDPAPTCCWLPPPTTPRGSSEATARSRGRRRSAWCKKATSWRSCRLCSFSGLSTHPRKGKSLRAPSPVFIIPSTLPQNSTTASPTPAATAGRSHAPPSASAPSSSACATRQKAWRSCLLGMAAWNPSLVGNICSTGRRSRWRDSAR